jgi:large subunit ribosomal protein L28
MPKSCAITGKTAMKGIDYKRRGMAKRKGGAGSKIVGKTIRRFKPNLQRVKARINGTVKRIYVTAKALKSGLVEKA